LTRYDGLHDVIDLFDVRDMVPSFAVGWLFILIVCHVLAPVDLHG
jgi:hypothetical protein